MKRFAVAMLVFAISACQPTVEERIGSARDYMDAAEYRAVILELKNALQVEPDNAEARAMMAHASYQLADFPTAADEYTRALELGAESPANWIGLARALLRMGDATGALERVVPNLDEHSDNESELSLQGDVYAALGNYDAAEQLFNRAVSADATSERGQIGLAIVAAARGQIDPAIARLRRAANATGAGPQTQQILGNLLRLRGDLAGATEAFQMSTEKETPQTPMADRFDTRAGLVAVAIDNDNLSVAASGLAELASIFPAHPLLNYFRGRLAFAEGDAELAATELREYLSKVPNDLRAHAVMGAISFSQSFYSQAEMYLQQAVRGNVGGDSTRRLLAETQLRLNQPQDALSVLRGANLSGSNDQAAMLGLLGRAEFGSGNRESGLRYFEQGVAAAPEDPRINMMYAMALISDGQAERAISILQEFPEQADAKHRREMLLIAAHERAGDRASANAVAAELLSGNPGDALALALVGSFKQGIGETAQAESFFQDALKIDPDDSASLMGLARFAIERGDTSAAEAALTTLLDNQPAYMPALQSLAQIFFRTGRTAQLGQRIDAAVTADPQSPWPKLLRAQVGLTTGDVDGALQNIRNAKEEFPDETAFRHLEGIALMQQGQSESALISLASAARDEPGNARFQFDLALARLQSRDYFGANEAIARFRALEPGKATGLSVQVNSLIGLRRLDQARLAISGFENPGADSAMLDVLTGDVELAAGDSAKAISAYEAASETLWDRNIALRLSAAYLAAGSDRAAQPLARWLADNPNDAEMRRSYGQILQSSGDRDKAIAEYERILEENRDDAVALNNLAWEYAQMGRKEAVDLARRAHDLMPEQGSIADTYGWILYKNGQAGEAIPLLRAAARLSPDNGEIHYHLAKVLNDTGEVAEANQIIATLLESGAQFPSRAEAEQMATSE